MGLSAKAGTFTVSSSDAAGTNYDVTCGFQPSYIIFWCVGRSDATDAVGAASHRRAIGFGVSDSDRRSIATASENSAAAADADVFYTDARCLVVSTSDGTEEGGLDLAAVAGWPADGFRVTVDDQFASSIVVSFLAIGGTDVTNAVTGTFDFATVTGNQDITSLAFQPDIVFFLGTRNTLTPPAGDSGVSIYSFGAAVSSTQQAVIAGGSDEGSATMDTGAYGIEGPEVITILAGANPLNAVERAAFVSMLSNGFRINVLEEDNSQDIVFYLAVKGGRYYVGSTTTRTDGNDITLATLGYTPAAMLFFSACRAESTQDTPTTNDEFSMGAATSASERTAQGLIDENGTSDSEITTAIEYDEVYINLSTSAAVEGLMDVKTWADPVICVMDDADPSAAMVAYVVIAAAATVYNQSVSGGMTPAGTVVNRAGKVLAGAITPDGALSRLAAKILAGGLAPDGAVSKQTATSMGGELTPAGVVTAIKTALISLGGALAPAGALALQTGKALAGAVTPDGTLVRSIGKILAGGLTPDGGLVRQIGKVLAGALAGAGDLATQWTGGGTQYLQSVAGALAPAGALALQTSKVLAGVLAPDGGLVKRTAKILAGALAPAGALIAALVGLAVPGRASASETVVGGAAASETVMGAGASETAVGGVTTTDG